MLDAKQFDNRKDRANALAEGYSTPKMIQEVICTLAFFALTSSSIYYCSSFDLLAKNSWTLIAGTICGMLVADYFSGIVHWACDTWGNLKTPLFGPSIIRSFREHHIIPGAIATHTFVQTNGDNFALGLPIVLWLTTYPVNTSNSYEAFLFVFLINICIWVGITNQIHKWAHSYGSAVPLGVSFLQNNGIILSKKQHNIHHKNPFDKHYCITTGWLNPLLISIDYWKKMEQAISYFTGAIPREDDIIWNSFETTLDKIKKKRLERVQGAEREN